MASALARQAMLDVPDLWLRFRSHHAPHTGLASHSLHACAFVRAVRATGRFGGVAGGSGRFVLGSLHSFDSFIVSGSGEGEEGGGAV